VPYRYYLRHVEKLKAMINDAARELDGASFGR